MSLGIKKETDVGFNPVFLSILEDIPGGITLKTNRIPASTKIIKAGALISVDSSPAGLYNLVKTAKLKKNIGAATCVTLYVYPTQEFQTGEFVGIQGRGTACTIASITKGSGGPGTDVIILTAGSGGLHTTVATNTILEECSAAAHTGAAVKYAATAILKNTIVVRNDDLSTKQNVCAAAIVRGTVNESLLPYAVTNADKTALTARVRFA